PYLHAFPTRRSSDLFVTLTTAWTRQPGRFPLSRMILPFLAATFAAWAETPDDAAARAEGPASAAWAGARDSEVRARPAAVRTPADRKSTRLNSSHVK